MRLIRKKCFNLLGSVEIGALEQWTEVMWWPVQVSSVPECWTDQSKKRGRRSDAPIRSSADRTSPWGGSAPIYGCCSCSGPGSATFWAQRMGSADHLNILTRLFHQWNFFLPRRLGHIPRWHCQDWWGLNCERVAQRARDIRLLHMEWPNLDSPHQKYQKNAGWINARMDEDQSRDTAEA